MTIFSNDRASPEVRESVRRTLSPVCEALGCGLGMLVPRLLPRCWGFELQRGSRPSCGAQVPCVWVFVSNANGRRAATAWTEIGWSLAGLVVAVHALPLAVPGALTEGPGRDALEAVVSTLVVGGYAGRHG